MNFEQALEVANAAVLAQLGRHLNDVETAILRGAWQSQTYEQIAEASGYSISYLTRDIGPKLWKLLSQALGEAVSKTSFQAALERQWRKGAGEKGSGGDGENLNLQAPLPLPSSVPPLPHADWGEAVDVSQFYGRTRELQTLEQWIVTERCRVVALLGMGGIGKTALAVKLALQVQAEFEYVIWRSLRNAPPLETLLAELVPFVSNQQETKAEVSRLMHYLRTSRCLLILDNGETILQGGNLAGQFRAGYEAYGELLRVIGETSHPSCLILTSREKPAEIAAFEGVELTVRSLQLSGSEQVAQALLQARRLVGSVEQTQQLGNCYGNNPLALKVVATSIQDLFGGEIGEFLGHDTIVFNGIRRLLDQQFNRLSFLEQGIMYWLAINREWTTITELRDDIVPATSKANLLEALESLSWRSLIEKKSGRYTQQPVVMEYVTDQLTKRVVSELEKAELSLFISYALMKTTVKDYVRESQARLILQPIANGFCQQFSSLAAQEQQILRILTQFRRSETQQSGYGVGNLINLCIHLQLDLTSYDFSNLTIRHAQLSWINLRQAKLINTRFVQCLFCQNFSSVLAVAFSPDDSILATGDIHSQICLWQVQDGQSLITLQGHLSRVYSVAWHPDGNHLASSSDDQTIKIWDVQTGSCLNTLKGHSSAVWSVAWSPDGKILASGSNDRTVRLWSPTKCIKTLQGHQNLVASVSWSPNGKILASGSDDQTVKLWDIDSGQCLQTLAVKGNLVREIAWSPNNQFLATSASQDLLIRIWHTQTGQCMQTLAGHTRQIYSVAWNPDGTQVASCSDDSTVRLWNPLNGQCLKTLSGHQNGIWAIAWSHNGHLVASGSQDETIRLWEVESGQCLRMLQGYSSVIRCVLWSADGKQLASSSADKMVRVWDAKTGQCLKTLVGHQGWVFSATWSPDGKTIASSSVDRTIKLWDVATGRCLNTLRGHRCWIWSVAYSPDGTILATGSSTNDLTVRLWDVQSGECLHILSGHLSWVWCVVWSSDGKRIASGGNDQRVKLWDVTTGTCIQTLADSSLVAMSIAWKPATQNSQSIIATGGVDRTVKLWNMETGECIQSLVGHSSLVTAIAWDREGRLLASGSSDGTLRLWDCDQGEWIQTFQGHQGLIWSVCFNPNGDTIASGSEDQTIRVWDISTGNCLHTLRADRPYEGMNITGVTGLTEGQQAILKALGAVEE